MSRKTNRKRYSVPQKRSSILPRILVIIWLLVIVVAILLIKEVPLAEILAEARGIPSSQEVTEVPNIAISMNTQAIENSKTPEHSEIIENSPTTVYTPTSEYFQTPEYSQNPKNTQEEVATITPEFSPASLSPAEQYKSAIANGKPTLVFFHSNTCKSCLDMIDTVNKVYPEFFHLVVLIDVNVYEPQNEDLIYRLQINFIPTLVFYNQAGDTLTSIGVISSEELRQKLSDISQGKIP